MGTKGGMVEIMCSLAAQRRIFFAGHEAAIAISIRSILGRRGVHWKNEYGNRGIYLYIGQQRFALVPRRQSSGKYASTCTSTGNGESVVERGQNF
jgi:hypothetical protein